MIRFKEIFLTESFKEKVNSYNIKNPYIQNFILRYENKVDWATAKVVKKSGDDVNRHIQSQAKKLFNKFLEIKRDKNNKKSIYSSENDINWDREVEILKTEIENGNDEAEQALAKFKENPKESKQAILDEINSGKRDIFDQWIYYLENNEVYKDNYAFKYILVKSVLDQDGSTRNPPTPINAAIIANLFEKIKQKPTSPFNVEKAYKHFYSDYLESKNEIIKGKEGQWMKIPSQKEDPENYENNIKDLMTMSYTSWCVRQDRFARDYLSKGAFWLYFVEDKSGNKYAEIAIRLVGDNIQEIRGATDDQKVPEHYDSTIVDFIEKAKDITRGQDFINKYYRKKYDKEYVQYLENNFYNLLEYYERHMPIEYIKYFSQISEEEHEENSDTRLLDWWRYNRKGRDLPDKEQEDERQLKFEFDGEIKEQEKVDDKFRFNSLLVGLTKNFDLYKDLSLHFGYNYFIVESDITLREFKEKTNDELIGNFIYTYEHVYEGDIYQVDYGRYDDYLKKKYPEEFAKLEFFLSDTDHFVSDFFQKYSSKLDDYSFYYGESAGERAGYESELYDKLMRDLPDALEDGGFSIENQGEYFGTDSKFQITMSHEDLIDYILEYYEDISYHGDIDWKEHWNQMNGDVRGEFDESSAIDGFSQEFPGLDEYLDIAVKLYAEAVTNDMQSIHIYDPNEYLIQDGIITYNNKVYKPLKVDDSDDFAFPKSDSHDDGENLIEHIVHFVNNNEGGYEYIYNNYDDIYLVDVNIPSMNQFWRGIYQIDKTAKVEPVTESTKQYLHYF